jgi:hypothetical protein
VIVALGAAEPAVAQQVPTPPPTIGGLFGGRRQPDSGNPDRSAQQLTFTIDAGGGYDGQPGENILSGEVLQTGGIAVSSAEVRHRWGTSQTYLESFVRGNASLARVGVEQQESAFAQIFAAVPLGRRAGLSIQGDAAYQPTYLFSAFGALAPQLEDGVVPDADLTQGFTEDRWLNLSGSGRMHRNWTPRQRTEISYSSSQREGVEPRRAVSSQQSSGVRHEWSYREHARLSAGYQFDRNLEYENVADLEPILSHRANLGLRLTKNLPRNRSVTLSFGGGATKSRTHATLTSAAADFVVPSGQAGFQTQFAGSWSFSVDANRDVTMLEGLSPRPFITSAGSVGVRGRFGREVEFISSAAYSHGVANDGTTGEFETVVGSARLYFPLTRVFGISTSYSYYGHQLFDLPELTLRLAPRQRRNSLRVIFNLWLPLFGTF